jgi:hypothetical protein
VKKNTGFVAVLREAGQALLQARYGKIDPVSGQGIQRGTRFKIIENGKPVTCAIKVAAGSDIHRIHFPRAGDEWSTLKDVDRVLYLRRSRSKNDEYEAQMYSQEVLLSAFNKNYEHAVKRGIGHLPAWLSPEAEEGDRFVGSGFGGKALWKSTGVLKSGIAGISTEVSLDTEIRPLTIQQAKRGLAASLGIAPEAIEIIIRT